MKTAPMSGCIMLCPPLFSTLRLNFEPPLVDDALQKLQHCNISSRLNLNENAALSVAAHSVLPDLLVEKGTGPHLDVQPLSKCIYVDKKCGISVSRGAAIYAPGVMGSNDCFEAGEKVSVKSCLKGRLLKGHKSSTLSKNVRTVFLGNGSMLMGRRTLFVNPERMDAPLTGTAVELCEPIWNLCCHQSPSTSGISGYWQNLPSVLTSHVLDPVPGDLVLDMCAAPGGKATHIAALMQNKGKVIALDRGSKRMVKLGRSAIDQGLTNIMCFPFHDSSKACSETLSTTGDQEEEGPPFLPETFDKILIDAPCSSLGQRPLFDFSTNPKELACNEPIQRRLLETGYKLLKRGGTLVYSTCTLRVEENERQVERFLSDFAVQPSQHKYILGNAPVMINGEDFAKKGFAQKFDPRQFCLKHKNCECLDEILRKNWMEEECDGHDLQLFSKNYTSVPLDVNRDTIGFFIAKFVKN